MDKIQEKEKIEFLNFISEVISKPEMYLIKRRIDYLNTFIDGYLFGRKYSFSLNLNLKIENWLFNKYSASLNNSLISSRGLLIRVFGNDEKGFKAFSDFLEIGLDQNNNDNLEDSIAEDKHNYQNIIRNYGVRNQDKLSYESKKYIENIRNQYEISKSLEARCEILLSIIETIVGDFNEIKVLICCSEYYMQIHFTFLRNNIWFHDEDFIGKEEMKFKMIVLHSYVQLIFACEKEMSLVTLHKEKEKNLIIDCEEMNDDFAVNNYSSHFVSFQDVYSNWRKDN
ncbi:hypothetical protein [Breznakia pachnodae]|uniref:Uncharacterized protein n=1 Tax=Breznakia pachnodae TaxID=265178 RepID=A0ABU0E1M6_9FIRM|nr:hypothetical protein [Breznakia pachnodae]MDQ0360623.1 hypothetical protein [Breznakia pachnodae]